MLFGINILREGQWQEALRNERTSIFAQDMAVQMLPFDEAVADAGAQIAAERCARGLPDKQAGLMRRCREGAWRDGCDP